MADEADGAGWNFPLRQQRGEVAKGYKIGFTNRTLWQRYEVFGPMWGTVWDTGLTQTEPAGQGSAQGNIDLTHTCQPRLEPEIVFGMKATPPANASLQQLFEAIDWLAPGFEVVQSHCLDWKFSATDTMTDGGLHARLLVGQRLPVHTLAADAQALHTLLAQAQVTLFKNGQAVEQGTGTNVLDSPLNALHHFLKELRQCPGAVDLQAGDVITTGTPPGVGMGRKPAPVFLKAGDVMRLGIDQLGEQQQTVHAWNPALIDS